MSGTYPTTPAPSSVTYAVNSPSYASVTHSGRIQTRERGVAGRFSFEFKYPPMTRATFAPLWAFLVAQAGRAETFQMTCPAITYIGPTYSAVITQGSHVIGDTLISTGSYATGTHLAPGDIVSFGSADPMKVYTVLNTVTGTGNHDIEIHPPLVADVGNLSFVNYGPIASTAPEFTVSLSSDLAGVDINHCNHHGGLVVAMRERL